MSNSQIALATEVTFPAAEKAKAYLENPEAFAVAAAPVVETKAAAVEKKEEKVEEKEESDDDMVRLPFHSALRWWLIDVSMQGFGLFD